MAEGVNVAVPVGEAVGVSVSVGVDVSVGVVVWAGEAVPEGVHVGGAGVSEARRVEVAGAG